MNSTVGMTAGLKLTEDAMARARADTESTRPAGMSAGEWYAQEVERLVERDGLTVTQAAGIVAEANGVSTGNVIAQRGAYRRSLGIRPLERTRRANPSRTGPHRISESRQEPSWDAPKELADILDALTKTQQEQSNLVAALKSWAQAQEKSVAEARERARDAVIRDIKAAADKL